jgi:ribosomal protein S18 acetylase RimI-like enzyme
MPASYSIRRIDRRKDLREIADLIDLCFGSQMDPDGKRYLDYLRKVVVDQARLPNTYFESDTVSPLLDGFVCKQNGKIIGNLNCSFYKRNDEKIYFISNVAVDPENRLRGIAKNLVKEALTDASSRNCSSAWLQVRLENKIAYDLYCEFGFEQKATRTTWINKGIIQKREGLNDLKIRSRKFMDAILQKKWFLNIYPQEILWQMEINIEELNPKFLQTITNTLSGKRFLHWSIYREKELIGVISWQSCYQYADKLWLALKSDKEKIIIKNSLSLICQKINSQKPFIINYPYGRAREAFVQSGFYEFNTLIWMEKKLK